MKRFLSSLAIILSAAPAYAGLHVQYGDVIGAILRNDDNVTIGTSTTNPIYTYATNNSTAPITVSIAGSTTAINVTLGTTTVTVVGSGPNGVTPTLAGRIEPATTGFLTTTGDTLQVYMASYTSVVFQIAAGTATGTVNFEESMEGVLWSGVQCARQSDYNAAASFSIANSTSIWVCSVPGQNYFRLTATGFSVGRRASIYLRVTGDPLSQTVSAGNPTAANLQAQVSILNTANIVQSTSTIMKSSNTMNSDLSAQATGYIFNSADELGRQLVTGIPRGKVRSSTITLSSANEGSFVPAGATGYYNDLCGCLVVNTSTSTTRVDFRGQGAGGTVDFSFQVPATDTRGFWPGCQNPFTQPSTATNWTAQLATAVTDVRISCKYVSLQ